MPQAKKKAQAQTIVAVPLTPELLREIGGLPQLPPAPADFRPEGSWVHTYQIFTCHGYKESGNAIVGFLRLERVAGGPVNGFSLRVRQHLVNDDASIHILEAEIRCRNDRFGAPVDWKLTSRFLARDGKPLPELTADEDGRALRRDSTGVVSADWCLFEAVQRMPFAKAEFLPFAMLEGLTLLRPDQRIFYRGLHPRPEHLGAGELHWFQQVGRGVLPYDYWVDRRHRLLAAATLARAYVLDDGAEELVRQRQQDRRQRGWDRGKGNA